MSFVYKDIDINFFNCYYNIASITHNRKRGEYMTASETLDLISKQRCSLDDLMKLGQFGRNSSLKIKREIKKQNEKSGLQNTKSFNTN